MMMSLPDYFDYMATTPIDPIVLEEMLPYLRLDHGFGNPSSVTHVYGRAALKAVDIAREQVAQTIAAAPGDIVFTSGATESNNLALLGAARLYQRKGKHLITMQTEHQTVLSPLRQLEREGFQVTHLQPDQEGLIDLEQLEQAITPETILVSIMQVNNEIGVIQPIQEVGQMLKGRGIVFHVDAAQSVGKVPVQVDELGVDLLSLSAHKNYGPKGIGALYIRSKPRTRILPIQYGGGQEHGLRPGTLATHQIVGMGAAYRISEERRDAECNRILALREQLWNGIAHLPTIQMNGHRERRIPGNLSISFEGIAADQLIPALSNMALSVGSACGAASHHPSYVLKAIGLSEERCTNTLRISLGRFSTGSAVERAIHTLKTVIPQLRG